MSSSQVKRYYRRSSGQKRAFDKQNMYQPSVVRNHPIGKPNSTHKQKHLSKRAKRRQRKQKNNQKHLAAAINEHSIYRERDNFGCNTFARAYQKAIENKKGEKQ